ncbi:MAG: cell division protein ZapA [Thermosipho sp. (in: Bacteria)]|nr:cell division protein ZapA [Thermosipho sp. (in: thermotogales)]MCD6104294.1 cell division protein ZapA [Thermosipho sp. (in: thermotogales)]
MAKKIFNLGLRKFVVESDSSNEVLDFIEKRLIQLNNKYSYLSSIDERFLAIICEILENEYKNKALVEHLLEKVKSLASGGNEIEDRPI